MNKYIRIVVSIGLLAVIAWKTDWAQVVDKCKNLRIDMWLAAVGLTVLAQLASARRWQLFARELRFERTLPQYFNYYLIGMYFNLTLPTSVGGDVMRVFYLNGNSGRKWSALASVLLERVNGLLVLIALACLGVVIASAPLDRWVVASVWGIAGCAVLGMASLPLLQRWRRLPLQRREQVKLMIELLKHPRVLVEATFMSVLVQGIGVVSLWCIGQGLGLDVPMAYYCIVGPLVSLVTLLPVSLNGMGVREGCTVLLLAPVGVAQGSALTLAFLWFAVTAAVGLGGGLIYLLGAFPRAETAGNLTPEETTEHGCLDRGSDQGRAGEYKKAA